MRLLMVFLAALTIVIGSTAAPLVVAAASHGSYTLTADDQQQPGGKLDVNVDVNRGGGGAWYTNPLWIAIGVIALILLIVLIVMASRGGGTTIVRE